MIFSNDFFFKDSNNFWIFDIEKLLWKSEFCNLAGLITLTKNVQKNFHSHFCNQWSISFNLKSFYQIPLTWSKIYPSNQVLLHRKCNKKEGRKVKRTVMNKFLRTTIVAKSRAQIQFCYNCIIQLDKRTLSFTIFFLHCEKKSI